MANTKVLGPVTWNPKGEYDEETTYEKFDVVEYQGSSYVAKKDTWGQLPTDSEYWELLVKGGLWIGYDSTMKALNIAIAGNIRYNSSNKELIFETV